MKNIFNKEWRKRNPDKAKAHWTVQNAIRSGKLIRGVCAVCSSTKVHAHHEDYSKPLEVIWLCPDHHEDTHHGIARPRIKEDEHGYTRKPKETWIPMPWQKPAELHVQALQMRADGASYGAIAKALEVTKGTVFKWINKPDYK